MDADAKRAEAIAIMKVTLEQAHLWNAQDLAVGHILPPGPEQFRSRDVVLKAALAAIENAGI